MDLIQLKLCDIQGRLFELSLQAGYGSEDFMKRFMRSKVARDLDSEYNRMQWAGEEYLLEEFADECPQTQRAMPSMIGSNVLGRLSLPLLAYSDQRTQQGDLCAGSGEDYEHKLSDVPHHGSRAGN